MNIKSWLRIMKFGCMNNQRTRISVLSAKYNRCNPRVICLQVLQKIDKDFNMFSMLNNENEWKLGPEKEGLFYSKNIADMEVKSWLDVIEFVNFVKHQSLSIK